MGQRLRSEGGGYAKRGLQVAAFPFGVAAVAAIAAISLWPRLQPLAILSLILALGALILGVWSLRLLFLRLSEIRLANRFGFTDLHAYYLSRAESGWDADRMAKELGRSPQWLIQAHKRWMVIREGLVGLEERSQ